MLPHAAKVCVTVGLCLTALDGFLRLPVSGLSFKLSMHHEHYLWAAFLLGLIVTCLMQNQANGISFCASQSPVTTPNCIEIPSSKLKVIGI